LQVSDEKKLAKTDADDMYEKFFSDPKKATKFMSLVSFQPFADTADAVSAAASCIEGKVGKSLKSFLKRELIKGDKKNQGESLAIADKLMASSLKEMLPGLKSTIMNDAKTHELFRGIRCYMDELMDDANGDDATGVTGADIRAMQLGLSHSLSRYKLKFSSDKVDTMVIQAVGLLDELDKEINTYAMRVKEWYGWHFPGTLFDNFEVCTHDVCWCFNVWVLTLIIISISFVVNRNASNCERQCKLFKGCDGGWVPIEFQGC
jgi:nucleolar protein 58